MQWLREASAEQASAWPLLLEGAIAVTWASGGVVGLRWAWGRMRSGNYSEEVL